LVSDHTENCLTLPQTGMKVTMAGREK